MLPRPFPALYDYKAMGSCGYRGFEKPYFLTLMMFVGEALCLLVYWGRRWFRRESTKIWLNNHVPCGLYTFDYDLANRRKRKEREARAHGIEPYEDALEHAASRSPGGAGSASILSDDDDDDEDEEKSLLNGGSGSGGASNGNRVTATRPNVDGSSLRRTVVLSDPDLLDLHLSEEELIRKQEAQKPSRFVYLGLCLFDLSASAIGGVGLLYIDASSNQMLRGSGVVFTALFSMMILRRRLTKPQWSAIVIVCAGLVLVGLTGLFRAHKTLASQGAASTHNQVSPSAALMGLLFVLLGSALNSIQNVFEEMLVKRSGPGGIDALELVGWEGVWGTLISGLILLPAVHYIPGGNCGRVESWTDTWTLMRNSTLIVWFVVGYTLSLALLNYSSVILSGEVSAVFRQLINALRVVFIWLVSIAMFYWLSSHAMGEGWDVYSWLQLGGFGLLLLGTIIYGTGDKDALMEDSHAFLEAFDDREEREKRNAAMGIDHVAATNLGRGAAAGLAPDSLLEDDDGIGGDDAAPKPKSKEVAIHVGQGSGPRIAKRAAGTGGGGGKAAARSPGMELQADPRLLAPTTNPADPPYHSPAAALGRRQAAMIRSDSPTQTL